MATLLAPLPAAAAGRTSQSDAEARVEPAAEEPDDDPQLDQAMRAYERGTQNYNLAQYEAALADFKEAASLYASADFQYNIGLCYEKLGKYDEAIRAYVTYLKAKPSAEDRPNVENRIRELQDAIEQQKRDAEAAEAARLAAEAEERGKDDGRVEPRPDQPPPQSDGRPLLLSGIVLIGVGSVVALGGGIAFGVLARERSEDLDQVLLEGNPENLTFSEAQDLEEGGKRFEAIQIGMAVGGAAVAVTGAVLLAVGLRQRKAFRASAAWLGPSTVGLSFTGRF